MSDKLTVVVPVYKVDKYIKECLDSLKAQKYEPLEFLLVDDGTPDSSAIVCDEYALSDIRFTVVHKKNTGLSDSRNVGIELTCGEYITFVDSDDALIGNAYADLMTKIKVYNADIITMDYCYGKSHSCLSCSDNDIKWELIDSKKFYEHLFNGKMDAVWDKIYKRKLFSRQKFDCGILNEDFLFHVKLAQNELKIIKTSYMGYFHRMTPDGITAHFGKNMIDAVRNAEYAYTACPYDEIKDKAIDYLLLKALMYFINMPDTYIKEKNSDYEYVYNIVRKNLSKASQNLDFRYKLCLLFMRLIPMPSKLLTDIYIKRKRE